MSPHMMVHLAITGAAGVTVMLLVAELLARWATDS